MLLIVILYAFWAASVTASKVLITYSSPIFLTGIRMFLAGLLLLGYQYFSSTQRFHFKKSHIRYYIQMILFGIYISYILRFWALEQVSATKTMFLSNLSPFFSALFSYFFFKEQLSKTQWSGLLLGFVGLIPVLLTTSKGEVSFGEFYFMSWQEFAIIVSVAMHSYSWMVMRTLVREKGYSPMMVNGISMFAGGALALITSAGIEGFVPISDWPAFAAILSFVIIISNIICHNLHGYLLREYSATLVAIGSFLGPIFAALYGWLLFNESITWHYYVSSVIVFFGLFLFYKEELLKNGRSWING